MTETIIACIVYFIALIILGVRGYKATKNSSDYLLGGRKTNQFVMAISYGATFISTSALIGFGGLAATTGMGLLWLAFMNVMIGVFIAFVFFGKRVHKLGLQYDAYTFPELMGKRFDSKMIQITAGAMIFLFMPIYAAAIIKGGVNFIEVYFGVPYHISLIAFVAFVAVYVMFGGLKAVISTDFLQGLILFVAMIALVAFVYKSLGGILPAHKALTDLFAITKDDPAVAPFVARGFQGWTSMPAAGSPIWWSLLSSLIGGVGFGVLAQPQLVVRFMTVKSTKDLNRAVLSGGVFILVMVGGAYTVGALINAVIFQKEGVVALTAAGGISDAIMPYFITNYLPKWYGAFFLIAMLAAAMSTLSAQFHTMGSALGRDLGGVIAPKYKNSVSINRYGMIFVIILSTCLAWMAKYLEMGEAVIAKGTIIFFEMTICVFLPVYIGALFMKNMPKIAAEAGVLSGAVTWFFWTFFLSRHATSLALCRIVTGKNYLLENTGFEKLAMMGSTVIGLLVPVIVIAIVWALKSASDRKAAA